MVDIGMRQFSGDTTDTQVSCKSLPIFSTEMTQLTLLKVKRFWILQNDLYLIFISTIIGITFIECEIIKTKYTVTS